MLGIFKKGLTIESNIHLLYGWRRFSRVAGLVEMRMHKKTKVICVLNVAGVIPAQAGHGTRF